MRAYPKRPAKAVPTPHADQLDALAQRRICRSVRLPPHHHPLSPPLSGGDDALGTCASAGNFAW
jgi:hypothetical protein